ncbi:hypothetical protein [Mycobacteroides abscessus]|uniref:hypothetical protein n=1 Tax=Mycobacteroides abscessus TaxID=36809 RepID=UPI0034E8ED81
MNRLFGIVGDLLDLSAQLLNTLCARLGREQAEDYYLGFFRGDHRLGDHGGHSDQ